MIGYRYWPKVGFDAELFDGETVGAPHLVTCRTVQDVVALDAACWSANGSQRLMEFDLRADNPSWQKLQTICTKRVDMSHALKPKPQPDAAAGTRKGVRLLLASIPALTKDGQAKLRAARPQSRETPSSRVAGMAQSRVKVEKALVRDAMREGCGRRPAGVKRGFQTRFSEGARKWMRFTQPSVGRIRQ
ncbi:hypothetical protein LJR267_010092 [Paraburkholderia hospita]|jgi:hypothetical protein|uniref:hypothetical protein n=1 Tax=Paraburkholderia hospita TaxID=169430 RepID=UPI003ECD31A8